MRTHLRLAFAISLLCQGLVACGDDGGDSDETGGKSGRGGSTSRGGSTGNEGGDTGEGGDTSTEGGDGGSEPPLVVPEEPGTVYGIVTDIGTGAGVPDALVEAGGQTTTTDDQGTFELDGLDEGEVTLSISAADYAPGFASAVIGETTQPVLARMKKQGTPQSYSTDTAMTLSETTEAGPYALILEPDSLDTDDTDLTISITPLDPTKEGDALPGTLVAGGATSTLLVPVTFAEFSILDSDGERVNLRDSASAIVELPIPPELRGEYPLDSKIHCYAYDPETGKWEDFVEGTVQLSSVDGTSPVRAASVRHFSWYGGAPEGDDCVDVYVKVVSAVDGRPLENARVEATPGTVSYTDGDGVALVRTTAGRANYVAYQTGIDVDGSLTGMAGAKYIEFGSVDEDLVGLVQKPCTGDPGPTPGQGNALGSEGSPLTVEVGRVTGVLYQATGILLAGDGTGQVQVIVEEGIPGPDGSLENAMPTSGAKIYFSEVGGSDDPLELPELAAGTGVYMLTAATEITAGKLYALAIDGDGNGSIDGGGTAFALGTIEWENPTEGATVDSSDFTASWTDTGSELGGDAYAPLYQATLSATDGSDAAYYIGTDREFVPESLLNPGEGLPPGTYTGSVMGFSGAFSGGNVTVTNNITGQGVTGLFYSYSNATTAITFTVE
jgi:hypothetical protein